MLQEMRKYAKSTVASIFLGLLALSFGVWGIADIFHGSADTTVASVGDAKISSDTYQHEYQNYIRNLSRQGKTLTPEQARAQGIPDQILQNLINRQAVDNVVNKLKLTASDDSVARQIKSIRAFAGPLGTFDHDTFLHTIGDNGYTEQSFIAAVRDDTSREQLLSAIKNGIQMPQGYAQAFFNYLNEERAVQYVSVPQASVAVATPTDAQLTAYVKAHANKFSTPEYRAVTYASIAPADVMDQVKVTDDQLKQEYEVRKATYVIPEKREIEQITFPDQKSAAAARADIDHGKSFADIAKARGLKQSDISLGAVVQEDLGKDRGPAAFALAENGVSQPVKGIFGYVLLHVTKITPGVSKSFDDVKADIKKDVMTQLAAAQLSDVSNKFEDAMAGGASLQQAAAKVHMHVVTVPAVDSKGMTPDGSKAAVPDEPEFLAQIFKAEIGDEGDPFQTKTGNLYVLRVDGVTPPKVRPLDQVRDEAVKAYTAEQRTKLLEAKAKSLAAEGNKQQSLDKVASELGTTPQMSGILTRGAATDTFPVALMEKIFSAPPGSTVYGEGAKDGAYIVARITGIAHPPAMPTNDPRYKQFLETLSNQLGDDMPSAFSTAARAQQGVEIDQKMADRVAGGGS